MLCIFGRSWLNYRLINLKMKAVIDTATIKILLHLFERDNARYSELLEEVIQRRSTLALALRDLQEEQLVGREVMDARPVQTRYSLTSRGEEVAKHLSAIKNLISKHSK